jgi:DNA-binding response OmpR family regulator
METDRISATSRPAKILVVEDERYIARFLSFVLKEKGYEVQAAHDGEEALSTAASFRPDAVILDLLLPKLSGQEVLGRLRADPKFTGLKILLLTGCPMAENDTGMPSGMGADAYCLKPIGPSALIGLLRQHGLPSQIDLKAGSGTGIGPDTMNSVKGP